VSDSKVWREFIIPRTHAPHPPEYRRQLVELVRAGRVPDKLLEEFRPTEQSIRNRLKQADRDEGHRTDGLTPENKGNWFLCSGTTASCG
jgi:transposase